MAARRTVATLMIALSIFVMLTLVLAVTTYIYVQQVVDLTARVAETERTLAGRERDLAIERAEKERLREIIGTAKDTADSIEAEYNDFLQTRYAAYQGEPRSLRGLAEWLSEGVQSREKRVTEVDAQLRTEASEKAQAVAQADTARQAAEQAATKAAEELENAQATFKKSLDANVEQMNAALAAQKEALAKSERLEAIVAELEKLGPALSPELRRRFSAPPAADQPTPWPERIRFVYRELLERQKAIQQLNAALARLGAADPDLQKLVLDAQPYDDRIDGFDARIAGVHSPDKTVTILCDSTAGMRPGLVLYVFDPDDPRPEFGSRKGSIEVIAIDSGTRARARITSDTVANPILAGDGAATTLWSPGQSIEIAVVGYVSFPGDGGKGMALLRSIIERAGGTVVEAVSPQTALVVDAGSPTQSVLVRGRAGAWRQSDETRRKQAVERARDVGARVVGLDALFDVLGLDRSALSAATLTPEAKPAKPAAGAPTPARSADAAVAY